MPFHKVTKQADGLTCKLLYENIEMESDMSRRKSVEKETFEGVRRILQLSDAEFEKWMDTVERAGLRLKGRARKTKRFALYLIEWFRI